MDGFQLHLPMKGDDLAGDLALEKVDLLLEALDHPLEFGEDGTISSSLLLCAFYIFPLFLIDSLSTHRLTIPNPVVHVS